MKNIETLLFSISVKEAKRLIVNTPVLIYDTLLHNHELVYSSSFCKYNNLNFDERRYVLLLLDTPTFKKEA